MAAGRTFSAKQKSTPIITTGTRSTATMGFRLVNVSGCDRALSVPACSIIHATLVYPLTIYKPFLGFYFFNGLLLLLLALHVFWAALIVRMVIKFLPGNVRSPRCLNCLQECLGR